MNYKKFIEKLEWDTTEEDFEAYMSGKRAIPQSLKKYSDKIKKVLPAMYKKRKEETDEFYSDFVNSKLFKLCIAQLSNTGYKDTFYVPAIAKTVVKTAEIMIEATNIISYSISNGGTNIQEMMRDYK